MSYGPRESNLGLLATQGFVTPLNPNGALLPFDFNTVYEIRGKEENPPDAEDLELCAQALRSPQLVRDAPLLLDEIPGKCLEAET